MTRNSFLCNINRLSDLLAAFFALGTILMIGNLDRMPDGVAAFLSMRVTVKNVLPLCFFLYSWAVVFNTLKLFGFRGELPLRTQFSRVLVAATLGAAPAMLFAATSVSGAFRVADVA